MKYPYLFVVVLLLLFSFSCTQSKHKNQSKNKNLVAVNQVSDQPNIIFFAVDDMNDFVNPLGHEQAITPNLDRLAEKGVVFSNAHAPNSYCAPSRTAIWTGLQSSTTGCYRDEIYQYDYPDLVPMHEAFKQAGYSTYGAGKLFHHPGGHVDLDGWDAYFARNEEIRTKGYPTGYDGDDLPRPPGGPNSPYYKKLGINKLIGAGFLEWWGVPEEDTHKLMGVQRTKWICDMLKEKHDKPFFMGLGLYTPHFPNYAPQKYFDLYDVEKIILPELPEDDLEDLPADIQKKQTNRRNQHLVKLQKIGAYKEAVRAYLAAVSYADGLLGEVLDALEASAYKDNTIVVFWSDQGYHLGEKGDWGKHTLWSETSRVPLLISGANIPSNKRVESTAGLIDLYPTLMELCNLPKQHKMDGKSLVPELMDDSYEDRDLFIPYHQKGSYAVVNENYRYIHYENGGEEFYNVKEDQNEWYNLISDEKNRAIIDKMKQVVPEFRKSATPKKSLNLIFDETGYHWESKNGEKPQMTL